MCAPTGCPQLAQRRAECADAMLQPLLGTVQAVMAAARNSFLRSFVILVASRCTSN